MNSKEIIKKVIDFRSPPRIGLDFNLPHQKDIAWIFAARLINKKYAHHDEWRHDKSELKGLLHNFEGEIRYDCYGNIYGRLNGKTKGECIKGALEDDWSSLSSFEMPQYDESYEEELKILFKEHEGRFILGALPVAIFSTMRDLRKLENLLMDLLLEEEMVLVLLQKVTDLAVKLIEKAEKIGFDGLIIYDDWGTQNALLISPVLWRRIFKPAYARLAREIHNRGMKFFIHSCGYVYEIINDFIEIGVDVLQFDQPELIGVERLSREFGGHITFWCPVDIQKVMHCGNKEKIQADARKMINNFGRFRGGFIAKDYPGWGEIDVKEEWAQWARDVFLSEGNY